MATVNGPASSTDNAAVRWDGTGGDTVQNSGILIDDSDNLRLPALGMQASTSLEFRDANTSIQRGGGNAQLLLIANNVSNAEIHFDSKSFEFNDGTMGSGSSGRMFEIGYGAPASTVNYLKVVNADAGTTNVAPQITAQTSSARADTSINLVPRGSGTVQANGNDLIAVAGGQRVLTTKGDLFVTAGTTTTRLPVGTDGQVLTADSAETNGVKWATPSSGGGGTGDVNGPSVSTDLALARWDGTNGNLLQDSGILLDDNNNCLFPTTAELRFRDTDQRVYSSSTSTLDLDANGQINLRVAGTPVLNVQSGALTLNDSDSLIWGNGAVYITGDSSSDALAFNVNAATFSGNLTAGSFGTPGDIILGDGTQRDCYPQTDLKIDLGKSSNRFNEGWIHQLHVQQSVANVSSPPTDAELDSAFGTPATLGRGFVGTVDDNDGDATMWICVTSDASWYYVATTKAV